MACVFISDVNSVLEEKSSSQIKPVYSLRARTPSAGGQGSPRAERAACAPALRPLSLHRRLRERLGRGLLILPSPASVKGRGWRGCRGQTCGQGVGTVVGVGTQVGRMTSAQGGEVDMAGRPECPSVLLPKVCPGESRRRVGQLADGTPGRGRDCGLAQRHRAQVLPSPETPHKPGRPGLSPPSHRWGN